MLKTILVSATICCFFAANGQTKDENRKNQIVRDVVHGYNNHNYRAMQKPWIWWSKILVTKKKLRKEFEPYHNRYGLLTVDTIIQKSKYQYVAKLQSEKDPRAVIYLSYIFNEHVHLQGFGNSYPELIYKKAPIRPINVPTLTSILDSTVLKKYTSGKGKSFNGCVAVLQNGTLVYERYIGSANFEQANPLNDSSLFELASITKQFTAVAILLLEQQGKLHLTDSLQHFFPSLPYPGITIEQLLMHTSGVPDYEKLLKKVWDKSKFANNSDVIDQLATHKPKPLFQSGTQFEYSNTGYVLLASIVEKVSGGSYAAYLKNNIFEPLGMSKTRVYNTRRVLGETLENYAFGYVYDNSLQKYVLPDSTKKYEMVRYQDAIIGDGSVNSCIRDLAKWEKELLVPRIIPSPIFSKALENHLLPNGHYTNYGYGFFLSGGGTTEPLAYHTGGWPGYCNIIMNFLPQQKQLIILSNNEYSNFTRMADDIARELIK